MATIESMQYHLQSSLCRVLSVVWVSDKNSTIARIKQKYGVALTNKYFKTRMSNKYIVSVPFENIKLPGKETASVNFTNFAETFAYLCEDGYTLEEYKWLPYSRQAHDIAMSLLFENICAEENKSIGNFDYRKYSERLKSLIDNEVPVSYEATENTPHCVTVGKQKGGKLKIAIANVNTNMVSDMKNNLLNKKPNRTYVRYRTLKEIVNSAIKEKVDMLVLPENYIPLEWLSVLASTVARENLSIIAGVEHVVVRKHKKVYNYTAVLLPFKYYKTVPTSAMFFQLKKHYSPSEISLIEGYGLDLPHYDESMKYIRPLYQWKDCYFPVYCCFELASIADRAEFMSWADMLVAVECNRDTNYFGNIVEALTRDLHCYCVQVNTSDYGDCRITQPKKTEELNLVQVKGGINSTLLVGEINIAALREFQVKEDALQLSDKTPSHLLFKPTPPGFNRTITHEKILKTQSETDGTR